MATLLHAQAESLRENTRYDVFVDDGAPSTGTIPAILVSKLNIIHDFAEKDIDAHLMLSKATVTFQVQNNTQESVFSSMAGAEESRFRIRIMKEGTLHFIGFVLLDLLTIDDTSGDYFLTIHATDGVARLKTIDYDGGGAFYDDYETIREHLQSILASVGLSDYYADGEEYYRINATLWASDLTPDDTTDQTDLIRCSYRAFRSIDSKGNVKFSSVYDVLLELCRAFGVRFMFSQGRYVITDAVDYARTSGPVRFLRYDIGGNALSTEILGGGTGTQWTSWTTESGELSEYLAGSKAAVTRAGGKIAFLPALREVRWSYQHYSKQNTLPTSSVWTNGFNPVPSIQNFATAPGLRLRVQASAELEVVPPAGEEFPSVPVHVVVGMRMWVTDGESAGKRLTRSFTVSGSQVVYDDAEWADGVSGPSHPFVFRASGFASPVSYHIETLTPVVPTSGTLRMQFFILSILKNGQTWAGADVNYTIRNPYMETAPNGSVSNQYNFSNFTAENTSLAGNSSILERTVLLGDGPSDNSFGRFEYFDGTVWVRTTRWRKYAGGDYIDSDSRSHSAVRARDVLALQEQPRQKINGTLFLRNYAPEYIYQRAGLRYLPYKANHNCLTDEVAGEWTEVGYAPSNSTDPTEVPSDDNPLGNNTGGAWDIVPDTSGSTTPGTVGTQTDIPPGFVIPGINTVTTSLDSIIPSGSEVSLIEVVATPTEAPLYAGDVLTITNPLTGETTQVTVLYDSGLGIPAPDQNNPPADAVPFYGEDGLVYLIPSDTQVAIVPFTPTSVIPEGAFIQPESQFTAQLQALLRTDHYDLQCVDFATSITTGFQGTFWRPGRRIGWHIRKVHFAFASNAGDTVAKINLKYYDATGFRYTVATHNANGLGSIQEAYATVADGYYRVEVETINAAAPEGLTVSIELIKINT